MKSMPAAGFAVLVLIALTACGESSSLENAVAATKVPPEATDENIQRGPANSCWLYEKYSVADCASLTALTAMSRTTRVEYNYPNSSNSQYRKPTHFIDLTKVNLNQNVTANFKLNEFMQPQKGRYAFFAEHVFGFVQKMREDLKVPLRVTSAFRSPAYNKRIRGATISRHMYGDALDLAGAPMSKMEAACRRQNASFIQLYSDGHIHCDWRAHALDLTFYSQAVLALVGDKYAEMSDEDFKNIQVEAVGRPQITVTGDIGVGRTIELNASLAEQEEVEALLTEWAIRTPTGEVFLSNDVQLNYKIEQPGLYNVYVRLGGYSDTNYELFVP